MSLYQKNGEKWKKCCACSEIMPVSSFHKNLTMIDGLSSRCRMCFKIGNKCRIRRTKEELNDTKKDNTLPNLFNVKKSDWVEAFLFLQSMGYNLSGDKSIHEQFCERHGLKPKRRTYEKSIQYSPKDLGLI